MQSQISKLEEFAWFVAILAISFAIGWFFLNPFVDFLSSKAEVKEINKPAPVEFIPAPINHNIPCDDTDCVYEMPEQII